MKLRNLCFLCLALFLVFTLGACRKTNSEPAPPTDGTANTEEQTSSGTNPVIDSTTPLRLALPNGICAQVVAKIPTSALPLQLVTPENPNVAKDLLLKSCSSNLILLSPQGAAELYRSGNSVQLVALVSSGTSGDWDSMECLVSEAGFLENHRDLISRFLTEYERVVSSKQVEGAFLATGWDMVDLVQQALEAQYEQNPDSNHSIPDGKFYYLPS